MAIFHYMKTIGVGKFKDRCLGIVAEVARTRSGIIITKRGEPVAKLVPFVKPFPAGSLIGSVREEGGDPFSTGEPWDADSP
jgi:prevent-host-death family protein